MLLPLVLACAPDEPVLPAVQRAPTVEEVKAKRSAEAIRASPAAVDAGYVKPEGVHVDVRYLGGRGWDAVRGEVANQLGAVIEERPTPDGDTEVLLDRGTVRLRDGVILMVDVPLPAPVGRTEALRLLGFPPATREYEAFTFEYRLLNVWGFRRLVLHRAERGGEEIDRVTAWKRSPGER
ncbi:MAG: hypothetical protein ACOZNI_20680 [Myxococcota bacterium]